MENMISVRKVIRTETMSISSCDPLSSMCHASKNLYNIANYRIRQEFFHEKRMKTSNYDMNHELKDDHNFMVLPSQTAQQTIGMVYGNWKPYFRSFNGTPINADLNAAYKIIKRVFPDAFADAIRGAGLHLAGLSIKDMINPQ